MATWAGLSEARFSGAVITAATNIIVRLKMHRFKNLQPRIAFRIISSSVHGVRPFVLQPCCFYVQPYVAQTVLRVWRQIYRETISRFWIFFVVLVRSFNYKAVYRKRMHRQTKCKATLVRRSMRRLHYALYSDSNVKPWLQISRYRYTAVFVRLLRTVYQ